MPAFGQECRRQGLSHNGHDWFRRFTLSSPIRRQELACRIQVTCRLQGLHTLCQSHEAVDAAGRTGITCSSLVAILQLVFSPRIWKAETQKAANSLCEALSMGMLGQ